MSVRCARRCVKAMTGSCRKPHRPKREMRGPRAAHSQGMSDRLNDSASRHDTGSDAPSSDGRPNIRDRSRKHRSPVPEPHSGAIGRCEVGRNGAGGGSTRRASDNPAHRCRCPRETPASAGAAAVRARPPNMAAPAASFINFFMCIGSSRSSAPKRHVCKDDNAPTVLNGPLRSRSFGRFIVNAGFPLARPCDHG